MRLTALTALVALLVWGAAPAFADPSCSVDSDGDGVADCSDNCIDAANPAQDDTDGDSCGNVCDGDFDQNSVVGYSDVGALTGAVGTTNPNLDVTEPIGDVITTADSQALAARFGAPPGPSGTTPGTTACP